MNIRIMRLSAVVGVIAVAIGALFFHLDDPSLSYLPWHDTPQWKNLLELYDSLAKEMYKDCESFNVTTTFGHTYGFSCGDSSNPPLFMFHGAGTNSIMLDDWLIKSVLPKYRILTVDFICDTGRSRPLHGDPNNCPATEEEVATWVQGIITHSDLNIPSTKKISLLGYSYGALLAVLAAEKYPPGKVDTVIAVSPASIFAPIEMGFMARAILFGLSQRILPFETDWFVRWLWADDEEDFDINTSYPPIVSKMTPVADMVGANSEIKVMPGQFSDTRLSTISNNLPKKVLLIGEYEHVTDHRVAVEKAKQHNWETKVYPGGHMMPWNKKTRKVIDQDIANLLGCNDMTTEM